MDWTWLALWARLALHRCWWSWSWTGPAGKHSVSSIWTWAGRNLWGTFGRGGNIHERRPRRLSLTFPIPQFAWISLSCRYCPSRVRAGRVWSNERAIHLIPARTSPLFGITRWRSSTKSWRICRVSCCLSHWQRHRGWRWSAPTPSSGKAPFKRRPQTCEPHRERVGRDCWRKWGFLLGDHLHVRCRTEEGGFGLEFVKSGSVLFDELWLVAQTCLDIAWWLIAHLIIYHQPSPSLRFGKLCNFPFQVLHRQCDFFDVLLVVFAAKAMHLHLVILGLQFHLVCFFESAEGFLEGFLAFGHQLAQGFVLWFVFGLVHVENVLDFCLYAHVECAGYSRLFPKFLKSSSQFFCLTLGLSPSVLHFADFLVVIEARNAWLHYLHTAFYFLLLCDLLTNSLVILLDSGQFGL